MDTEYTKPESVEMFGALLFQAVSDRIRSRDRPRLAEAGFQPGVLRGMNQPWHQFPNRQLWLDAVREVLVQVSDPSKTWTGIPPGPEQFRPRDQK